MNDVTAAARQKGASEDGGTHTTKSTVELRFQVSSASPLLTWIRANPEVLNGAQRGFRDIREGRFRRVSLNK
jgi:hypothetical protein